MKTLKMLFVLTSFVVPFELTWAELSVWDSAKRQTNSIEGRIKAIVLDENQRQVHLKVETSDSQIQTVKVCNDDIGYDFRTFEQSEKMHRMREAFRGGSKVKISYDGPFNRCLSSIDFVTPTATASAKSESI